MWNKNAIDWNWINKMQNGVWNQRVVLKKNTIMCIWMSKQFKVNHSEKIGGNSWCTLSGRIIDMKDFKCTFRRRTLILFRRQRHKNKVACIPIIRWPSSLTKSHFFSPKISKFSTNNYIEIDFFLQAEKLKRRRETAPVRSQ